MAVIEPDVGTVTATFTVTLSAASGKTVTVDFATANGTATSPADYTASSGTFTFNPGQTTKTIDVAVQGDLLNEANETYTVTLTNPTNATIPVATRTGTITDNDPLPSIVINDVSLTEGNSGTTNADFTVTLSAPSGRNVTVNYATANATATQPADYTTTSGTLTFTPGQVTKTVSVPVVGDTIDEIDETFVVNLTVPVNVTIADNQGVGTVTDDDPLPSITINDVSLTEATANMTFTVTLSGASGKTVTVDYATADGTATSPADYTSAAGTVSFAPGIITRTFTVPIVGDTLDEFDETLLANLSNPTNATISDNQGVGTITDDDAAPSLSIWIRPLRRAMSAAPTATFTVSLSAVSGKPIAIDYQTTDATATTPADYASASGTISFPPGATISTVDVQVQGDTMDEFDETFTVDLLNPVNSPIADNQGLGTITDDDAAPGLSVNDISIPEGDTGTTNASLTVALSAPSGKPISVDYSTADGSADSSDYAGISGTVLLAPGETSRIVDVAVSGDRTYEPDETFTFALQNPVNATLGSTPAAVSIQNDDSSPRSRSMTQPPPRGTQVQLMRRSPSLSRTLPCSRSPSITPRPTARPRPRLITRARPGRSRSLPALSPGPSPCPVVGDTLDEFDETLLANLSNPTNATISDNQGVGTITDDDAAPSLSILGSTIAEGDVGSTTATFTVSLSAVSGKPIAIDYQTTDATATTPADYASASGTISFPPGATISTVDVQVQGDTMDEFDETFTVDLLNPVNSPIADNQGLGTITDDDAAPGLSVNDISIPEGDTGNTIATFTVVLGAPSALPVTVDVTTQDGTATATDDYDALATSLLFAPGDTSRTIDVTVNGDTTTEGDETLTLQLSGATNASASDDTGIATIVDDDKVPSHESSSPIASVGDVSIQEHNAGKTVTATFDVRLSRPAVGDVTLDYQSVAGTATDGHDYLGVAGTVTIPVGSLDSQVSVTVLGDNKFEKIDETFIVEIPRRHLERERGHPGPVRSSTTIRWQQGSRSATMFAGPTSRCAADCSTGRRVPGSRRADAYGWRPVADGRSSRSHHAHPGTSPMGRGSGIPLPNDFPTCRSWSLPHPHGLPR